jgi:hypothetical protein
MKDCDNSKIHISSNFILSIRLLIMFDTLLLRPSIHCNTPLHFTTLHPTLLHYTSPHFTTLHPTTLHYTYRHFTSSHLHFITHTNLQDCSINSFGYRQIYWSSNDLFPRRFLYNVVHYWKKSRRFERTKYHYLQGTYDKGCE